jgi:hypothetical protein
VPEYLVEVYVGRLRTVDLSRVARRARTAETQADASTTVHYRGSIAIPEDETCFHLYTAPSAAAVIEAARRAGIHFDRIVEAVHLDPEGASSAPDRRRGRSAPIRPALGRRGARAD